MYKSFIIQDNVKRALASGDPVLALESTIISHGMPYPQNIEFALKAENIVRAQGVVPATIAVLDGLVHVGLEQPELERLCVGKNIEKTASRDLGWVISQKLSGATTVSASIRLAHQAGIKIFATGGIGGVHRGSDSADVSQDLKELGQTPIIVISAGAKSILNLSGTLEYLETEMVPVVGYKCNEFPAFYSRSSGLNLNHTLNNTRDIARFYYAHLESGLNSALLIVNPISKQAEIKRELMEVYITDALSEANRKFITGKKLTPYLLKSIYKKTAGKSLIANISLALNNVMLGAEIARAL